MAELKTNNEYFSIKQTLECGQIFRYKKTDSGYVVYSMDKKCELSQNGECVTLKTEHLDYFKRFFDLDTDYGEIVSSLSAFPELTTQVKWGKGIRILRQDFYETVISFIISANNNITRIQGIIERLSEKCGSKMDGYYAFPTAKQLQTLSVDDFKVLGLGYRAPYLYETVRVIESVEKDIRNSDTASARKKLIALKGVGPKVADCILLFGLGRTDSYPVDTWIFKAGRTDELDTREKVSAYYLNRYGKNAGYAQQYVFYYAREGQSSLTDESN